MAFNEDEKKVVLSNIYGKNLLIYSDIVEKRMKLLKINEFFIINEADQR